MSEKDSSVKIKINGKEFEVNSGSTVASALLNCGFDGFRKSVTGSARGPLCGMGICYECRTEIDGNAYVRSCMVLCRDGMEIVYES